MKTIVHDGSILSADRFLQSRREASALFDRQLSCALALAPMGGGGGGGLPYERDGDVRRLF